jgi:hypothetical protein
MDGTRSKRRNRGPRSIAGLVPKVTKAAFARRGFAEGAIVTAWPTIIGRDLAARCVPDRIVGARDGSGETVLRLRVAGGSLATELLHLAPQLIERVNTFFGYRAVTQIGITQGQIDPPPAGPERKSPNLDAAGARELAATLEDVGDTTLKAALERLGRRILARTDRDASE